MPTPTTRTPLRVARGTYSNLNSSVSDIQEGEICYATDQDKLYVKEGSSLVSTQADISTKANSASPSFTGTVDFGGSGAEFDSNGQLTLKYQGTQTDPYLRILNRDDSLNNAILMYGNGSASFAGTISGNGSVGYQGNEVRVYNDYNSGTSGNGGIHLSYTGTDKVSMITAGSNNTTAPALKFAFVQGGEDPKSAGKTPIQFNYDGSSSFAGSLEAGAFVCNKGSRAVIQTLTDGATITPDFAEGTNFTVTLAGNRTIANPSNLSTAVGQSGSIFLVQDGTGSRTCLLYTSDAAEDS